MRRFFASAFVLSALTFVGCADETKTTTESTVETPSGTTEVTTEKSVETTGDGGAAATTDPAAPAPAPAP